MGLEQIKFELQEFMGSDASVAGAAWTSSYDLERRETKTDEQIADCCRRIVQDGHRTPVESIVMRFWVRFPIFSDRQHMTHRIATHNGLSGRYRTMPMDYYELPGDVKRIMKQAQASQYVDLYDSVCLIANERYREVLAQLRIAEKNGSICNRDYKRAREVLRGMLPQSGMTERTTIMNLGSVANYILLRNSQHAQPEIRYAAKLLQGAVETQIAKVAPVTVAELKKKNWILGPDPTPEELDITAQEMLECLS